MSSSLSIAADNARSFVSLIRAPDRLTAGLQIAALAALRHLARSPDASTLWTQIRNEAVHYGGEARLKHALTEAAYRVECDHPDLAGLFNDVLVSNILQAGGALPEFVSLVDSADVDRNQDPTFFGHWFDATLDEISHGPSIREVTTPRSLARLMVKLSQVDWQKTFLDPCCGMGATLAQAFKEAPNTELYGQEVNALAAAFARLRLYLLGATAHIDSGDVLRAPARSIDGEAKKCDVVVCDPPVGLTINAKSDRILMDRLGWIGSNRTETLFLAHCLQSLTSKGRAVLLMPYSFLARHSEAKVRASLTERGRIEGIISLPRGVIPWTEMQFAIVILREHDHPSDHIKFVDGEVLNSGTKKRTFERLSDAQADSLAALYFSTASEKARTIQRLRTEVLKTNDIDLQPSQFFSHGEGTAFDFDEHYERAKNAEAEADEARQILDELFKRFA